jgi:hypothetical protein
MNNRIFLSLYSISFLILSSLGLAQAPSSLVGQTVTFDYQTTSGEEENGTVSFRLFNNNLAWEIDSDDGEWESASYEWTPSGNTAIFVLNWDEGEFVEISMNFTSSQSGTITFESWEITDSDVSAIENTGN